MRGTVAKELRRVAMVTREDGTFGLDRALYRKIKREHMSKPAGSSPDTANRKRWVGGIPPRKKGKYHPLRALDAVFADLSDVGRERAMRLKFLPERTSGSELSLRAWPRGRPGQGAASRMDRPALLAVIADIEAKHKDVQQYTRFF